MEETGLEYEAEQVASTLAQVCKERGNFRALFVLAHSDPNLHYTTHYFDEFETAQVLRLNLYLPVREYATIEDDREPTEVALEREARMLGPVIADDFVYEVRILPRIQAEPDWKLAAKATLVGEGVAHIMSSARRAAARGTL